jgi:hypothetical protein
MGELKDIVTTDFPHANNQLRDVCLVIGGAPCVWEDFKYAKELFPNSHTLAVNAIGAYVPGSLTYWFSLHCAYLKTWHQVRKMTFKGHNYKKPLLFSLRHTGEGVEKGDIDAVWQFGDPTISRSAKHGGSLEDSGFFAMCIALVLGYKRVLLVGCPADDSGHIFIPQWEYLEHDKEAIRKAWESTLERYPEVCQQVRSCSGLTKELLGAPA